ncbi:ComEC/Rec2 family competence protein [Thermithiobacillus plumbiphilus]|uniref:ComEC/Rec2 family competence protein n=1 Tax=Thermithiobacillus plumbiphilus TaxID=1729899 RepID=A0ABU9DD40_9PROT
MVKSNSLAESRILANGCAGKLPALPGLVSASGLGLGALYFQPAVPAFWPPLVIAILAGILACWRWPLLWLLAAGCIAFSWGSFQAQQRADDILPAHLAGRGLDVEGVIVSLPRQLGSGSTIRLLPERVFRDGKALSWRGLVELRVGRFEDASELAYGQRWRMRVRLNRPMPPANPGGYDRAYHLFWEGVAATGTVVLAPQPLRLAGEGGSVVMHWIQMLRQRIIDASNVALPRDRAGLVQALTIGVQDQIPGPMWQGFVRSGTAHLMVISGSHITLVAGIVFFLIRWGWGVLPWLARRYPAQSAAAIGMLLTALFYGLMAGMGLATQRAVIMVWVLAGALLFQRELRPFHSLSLAALIVFILQPGAVAEPGFWLSFSVVLLIFLLLAGYGGIKGHWRKLISYQLMISLGMLPLLGALFASLPLFSPLANLFAIPVVEGLATPLALLGAMCSALGWEYPGRAFFYLSTLSLEPLLMLVHWIDQTPWATLAIARPSPGVLVAALLGLGVLLLPVAWPGRLFGIIGLIPLFLPPQPRIPADSAELAILDAGVDSAFVLSTRHHTLLMQALKYPDGGFYLNQRIVGPFLRSADLPSVDAAIVNFHHPQDRVQTNAYLGLVSNALWQARSAPSGIERSLSQRQCLGGESWEWDGVTFVFLDPLRTDPQAQSASCVLAVYGRGWQILLTGELDPAGATRLAHNFGANLKSDLFAMSVPDSAQGFENLIGTIDARHLVITGNRHAAAHVPALTASLDPGRSGALMFSLGEGGALRLANSGSAHYWFP